ncbi:MAG: hypothetical protein PHT62_09725 [Desulfotomaculaceae bacterium]|nr:hypothetical protein [Desulfotomaculaceae bacterium]
MRLGGQVSLEARVIFSNGCKGGCAGPGRNILGLAEGTTVVTASFNGLATSIKVEVIPKKETAPSQNTDSTQSVTESLGKVIKLNNDYFESSVRQALNKPTRGIYGICDNLSTICHK